MLILLRAEALFFTGDPTGAIAALNIVRTVSGGLPPLGVILADADFVDALLYERRYSLMFEGGHRWIDTRRCDRPLAIPLDMPNHVRNIRYPLPLAECNARPASRSARSAVLDALSTLRRRPRRGWPVRSAITARS